MCPLSKWLKSRSRDGSVKTMRPHILRDCPLLLKHDVFEGDDCAKQALVRGLTGSLSQTAQCPFRAVMHNEFSQSAEVKCSPGSTT